MPGDARQSVGISTLAIGLVFGVIWLVLVYLLPGSSWWDTKVLVVAVCFVSWGIADVLPHAWRTVAAALRAAVLIFLLAFGAWVLLDLLTNF